MPSVSARLRDALQAHRDRAVKPMSGDRGPYVRALVLGFLQDTDVSEDGWLPAFVGVVAALSEARQLAGSVVDTYRPLVDEMGGSLEGLLTTIDELREMDTTGAAIAAVGNSITDIGNAMDALTVQLRTPCPAASPAPWDGSA